MNEWSFETEEYNTIRYLEKASSMSASTLVAVGRGWTPEEEARHEVALFSALASDKKALRVYLLKVRVVEAVRAGRQQHRWYRCLRATPNPGPSPRQEPAGASLGRLGSRSPQPRSSVRGGESQRRSR